MGEPKSLGHGAIGDAIAAYAPTRSLTSVILVALVFGVVNLPSVGLWTVMGQSLQRVLTNRVRLRIFNFFMAFLLAASAVPVLLV